MQKSTKKLFKVVCLNVK